MFYWGRQVYRRVPGGRQRNYSLVDASYVWAVVFMLGAMDHSYSSTVEKQLKADSTKKRHTRLCCVPQCDNHGESGVFIYSRKMPLYENRGK